MNPHKITQPSYNLQLLLCFHLQAFIEEYFLEDDMASEDTTAALEAKEASIEDASRVRADVRAFVMTHADHAWSGRAVARVFHGIGDDDDITVFLCF